MSHRLWQLTGASGATLECVMESCCAGAELQVRRIEPDAGGAVVLVRELYPLKSDLYERARMLEIEYASSLDSAPPP
jgi:hypothetical protein